MRDREEARRLEGGLDDEKRMNGACRRNFFEAFSLVCYECFFFFSFFKPDIL